MEATSESSTTATTETSTTASTTTATSTGTTDTAATTTPTTGATSSKSTEDQDTSGSTSSSSESAENASAGLTMNADVRDKLRSILRGEETIKHHMQFLIKNNHTDMLILKQIKDSVRMACTHNGTVIANGLMHIGTTCDDFLRLEDFLKLFSLFNNF